MKKILFLIKMDNIYSHQNVFHDLLLSITHNVYIGFFELRKKIIE